MSHTIVPRIKLAQYITAIEQIENSSHASIPLYEPLFGDLILTYAIDVGENYIALSEDTATDFEIDIQNISETAKENALPALSDMLVSSNDNTHALSCADNMIACSVLFPALWQQIEEQVGGPVIVAIPHRDLVIYAPAGDKHAVCALRHRLSEVDFQETHALSKLLYIRDEGEWQVYSAPQLPEKSAAMLAQEMYIENNNWLIERSEKPLRLAFKETYASLIIDICAESPASVLGLEVGDYLVSVDEAHACNVELLDRLVNGKETVKYRFYSRSKHCHINVQTFAIPLGITTQTSTKGILKSCSKEGFQGWKNLETLWERQEWKALLKASALVSLQGLLIELIRLFNKEYGLASVMLFKGAALYERGKPKKAMKLINYYKIHFMDQHTTAMQAIAYYYSARWAELNGNEEDHQHWLAKANKSNSGKFECITQAVIAKGVEQPCVVRHWMGKPFPLYYQLNILNESSTVSLQESLSSMGTNELLPICVMPNYRGNGPYNDSMLCYRAMQPYISHRLRPLQVIIDLTEKFEQRAYWYENEEQAIASDMEITLLHDPECSVAKGLQLEYSPVFYLLDNKAMVRYEGLLNQPIEYYKALDSLS